MNAGECTSMFVTYGVVRNYHHVCVAATGAERTQILSRRCHVSDTLRSDVAAKSQPQQAWTFCLAAALARCDALLSQPCKRGLYLRVCSREFLVFNPRIVIAVYFGQNQALQANLIDCSDGSSGTFYQ